MYYKIIKTDKEIIFQDIYNKEIKIRYDDISEFVIDKSIAYKTIPIFIMGRPSFMIKELKDIKGDIVIGLKKGLETTTYKKRYKKIVTEYEYVRIKHIDDVYGLAEILINLGLNYDNVVYKDIKKYDYDDNEIYSCTHFFYHKV